MLFLSLSSWGEGAGKVQLRVETRQHERSSGCAEDGRAEGALVISPTPSLFTDPSTNSWSTSILGSMRLINAASDRWMIGWRFYWSLFINKNIIFVLLRQWEQLDAGAELRGGEQAAGGQKARHRDPGGQLQHRGQQDPALQGEQRTASCELWYEKIFVNTIWRKEGLYV